MYWFFFLKKKESFFVLGKERKNYSIAELLDELELNGRRLIVVPAVRREDVDKAREESKAKKKKMMDRKNTHLLKEGLTNVEDFNNKVWPFFGKIHTKNIECFRDWVSETRKICSCQRGKHEEKPELSCLYDPYFWKLILENQAKNTYIGLRIRNLPKRGFTPAKLKELFKNHLEEYIKKQPAEEQPKLKRNKLIIQSKIMYEDPASKTEESKSKVSRFFAFWELLFFGAGPTFCSQ